MRVSVALATFMGAVVGICTAASMSEPPPASAAPASTPSAGSPAKASKLSAAYDRWRAEHEENGGDRNIVLALRWHKALSTEQSAAEGTAHLDLIEGVVTVDLNGIAELGAVDVWFVDNQDGEGRSVKPEEGDRFLYVGEVRSDAAGRGSLRKIVGAELRTFEVDLVMVTRKDAPPAETGLLFGSLPLFQRLYSQNRIDRIRP